MCNYLYIIASDIQIMGKFFIDIFAIMASVEGQEAFNMFHPRGYEIPDGYVGFLPDGSRLIFPTCGEYLEYVQEDAA